MEATSFWASLSIPTLILITYLLIKFNSTVTVIVKAINTVTEITDESIAVAATDVRINLAEKKMHQMNELSALEFIPTTADIDAILKGKSVTPASDATPTRSRTRQS